MAGKDSKQIIYQFPHLFSVRDKDVHHITKLRPVLASNAEYHSATNVNTITLEERLTSKLEDSMAALVMALDETVRQVVNAPATANAPTNTSSAPACVPAAANDNEVLTILKGI